MMAINFNQSIDYKKTTKNKSNYKKSPRKHYTYKERKTTMPYWCPGCQCFHYASMPKEVEHGGLFDAKLTAVVAYMKGVCHASYSTIRKFLRDIIGVKVSRGYLKKILEKVSDSLEPVYNELKTILPEQKAAHIDESSLPENGKKLWIWVFETELFSFYKINPSRGSKVLIEMLGKNLQGVIGCDYFSAYRKYMKDFNAVVQFCLAHLIRDIKFLCDQKDDATKTYGERLRELMRELFEIIHWHDACDASVFTTLLQAKKSLILAAATLNVPTTREAQNLAKRFVKHGESFFTLITNPEIEPTNNIAERAVRFITIDRRVTQGVRGEYLQKHATRLNYRKRLAEGKSIGSGQVEGACKNLIGRRLKQTGARWKVQRVNRMAPLCAVLYSQQWNTY